MGGETRMGEHTENGREFLTPVGEVNLLSENAPLTIQVCVCSALVLSVSAAVLLQWRMQLLLPHD